MKGIVTEGTAWGRLRCVKVEFATDWTDDGDGTSRVISGEQYTFLCDCGKQFNVWKADWQGKRKMKDCGCGLSLTDEMHTTTTVYAPTSALVKLKHIARARGISLNHAIVMAMQAYTDTADALTDHHGANGQGEKREGEA